MPILLAKRAYLPQVTSDTLKTLGIEKTLIIGGTDVISTSVSSDLPSPSRLGGKNRYETSSQVAYYAISNGMSWAKPVIVSGEVFSDALIGGPLGAKLNAPMVLVHPNNINYSTPTRDLLSSNKSKISQVYVGTGSGSISSTVIKQIQNILR